MSYTRTSPTTVFERMLSPMARAVGAEPPHASLTRTGVIGCGHVQAGSRPMPMIDRIALAVVAILLIAPFAWLLLG